MATVRVSDLSEHDRGVRTHERLTDDRVVSARWGRWEVSTVAGSAARRRLVVLAPGSSRWSARVLAFQTDLRWWIVSAAILLLPVASAEVGPAAALAISSAAAGAVLVAVHRCARCTVARSRELEVVGSLHVEPVDDRIGMLLARLRTADRARRSGHLSEPEYERLWRDVYSQMPPRASRSTR